MSKLAMKVLAAFVLAQEGGKDIPKCHGVECHGDDGSYEAGQPAWCQNSNANGYKKNCNCKRTCDHMDRGKDCATFCRTQKCRCDHGCSTEEGL